MISGNVLCELLLPPVAVLQQLSLFRIVDAHSVRDVPGFDTDITKTTPYLVIEQLFVGLG